MRKSLVSSVNYFHRSLDICILDFLFHRAFISPSSLQISLTKHNQYRLLLSFKAITKAFTQYSYRRSVVAAMQDTSFNAQPASQPASPIRRQRYLQVTLRIPRIPQQALAPNQPSGEHLPRSRSPQKRRGARAPRTKVFTPGFHPRTSPPQRGGVAT